MEKLFHLLGFMGIPLLLAAALILAVITERLSFFAKARTLGRARLDEEDSPLSDWIPAGVMDKLHFEEYASLRLSRFESGLNKHLGLLRILGALSPLLGLLGTVIGMLETFSAISQNPGPVTPHLVAAGIYQALWTTAVGLSLAIVALAAQAGFRLVAQGWLERLTDEINHQVLTRFRNLP